MSSGFINMKYAFKRANGVYIKTSKSKDLRALSPPPHFSKRACWTWWHIACTPNIWEEGDSNSRSSSLHKKFSSRPDWAWWGTSLKKKKNKRSWGDGSVDKVPAVRTWGPSSNPQNLHESQTQRCAAVIPGPGSRGRRVPRCTCTDKHTCNQICAHRDCTWRRERERGKDRRREERQEVWEQPGFHSDHCFSCYVPSILWR